jgi:vacuolar-type H+-ATPase subunit E/Vma4
MSTVTEIEAALPTLSAEELRHVEKAVHRTQQQQSKPDPAEVERRLQAFRALQKSLALDSRKVAEWIATVRDSRR